MNNAVTKADLVQCLFDTLGINKREAKEVVDLFFDELAAALVRGESIKLPGLGVFTPKHKTPRIARNPKTGESVTIEKRRVVVFKPMESLKQKVQSHDRSASSI